ncbi:hypothetical protein Pdw03_8271 [Penicillium digitatum]|uniref:Uncharacterized protein n=1 Tax=Penicillium digitatum TaxID=36651 RepID=A0A7T6XN95_PENDI|nr:hypothetical protein Pdw03_8271 [Penicillium digitatum]
MDNSLAEIVVAGQSTKHPPTAMEVDIGCSALRLTLVVELGCGLEYSYGDLQAIDRTFLFCGTENVGAEGSAIGNGITSRVLAEFFDQDLRSMQSPGIKCIVVYDVDWVLLREQLRGDAIVKWLEVAGQRLEPETYARQNDQLRLERSYW